MDRHIDPMQHRHVDLTHDVGLGNPRQAKQFTVLVGVNPDIASKLVDLEADLGRLTSRGDMEAGLRYALRRLRRSLDVAAAP